MAVPDNRPPGAVSIFISAVLSLILGGVLALVHLASQPVEVLKSAPKDDGAQKLSFIQGAPGSTASRAWEVKRESLSEGARGTIALSEAELNAWAADTFVPAKLDDAEKGRLFMILAGVPNFRITGGDLQVGMVNTVNFFGSEAPLVLQARGGFEKTGSGWRFVAKDAMLGALPLHKLPPLMSVLADRFGAAQPPEVVKKVMGEAREISVGEDGLVVSF